MVSKKIIDEWLKIASKDLKIAQEDINRKDRFEYVGYHCQQAAEKFLKAYIVAFELKFQKTHDLEVLLETCIQKDQGFEKLRTTCRLLTPFYIQVRYPDFEEGSKLKKEIVKDALKRSQAIAKFVKQKLEAAGARVELK